VQGAGAVVNSTPGFGITISAPSSGTVHTNPLYSSTYSANTPTAGLTKIQWVNRSDAQDTGWSVITATILAAVDNGNDTWNVVLDTPLVFTNGVYDFYGNSGVAVGDIIFPAATNTQAYLDNVMQQFALLGPAQCTNILGFISLGAQRYPSSNTQFAVTLGVQLEKSLVANNQEVYQANVTQQTIPAASPNDNTAYNTGYVSPPQTAPPNILIPQNIGFYPTEFYNFITLSQ
jgi:hypothetical protein